MGRSPDERTATFQRELEQLAKDLFDPQLDALGLSLDQIEAQSLDELETSLDRISDAIAHPEAFGTFNVMMTAEGRLVIARAGSKAPLTVGALPVLLQRKK
ncbi:hypothetical protein [Kitasatospora sp. NPDC059571]|uniref:hypothetical protein n=1 Tax=Kitasatospora sp. NPDC059571 TaxID=3346871 RepID=UPI00367ED4AC